MRLAVFKTVRGRLLALLVAIALPIACLTAIAAVTTYRTVITSIEASQIRAADDFAVRTRVWYRGALRSLLTSGTLIESRTRQADCDAAGRAMLAQLNGYRALSIVTPAGLRCSASRDAALGPADLAGAMSELAKRPAVTLWAGTEAVEARYDQVMLAGTRYLAVYARNRDAGAAMQEGLLLVDPTLLDQVFDLGEGDKGLEVALVAGAAGIITARGDKDADMSWLPAGNALPGGNGRWIARSNAAGTRAYAVRMIAEPDIYIIASFDGVAETAAKTQFFALLLAPLLTLVLLCAVYMRAIDNHCVRWLRGIEAAARARASQPQSARAPLADDMPQDIRSVAEAFNMMVDEQEVRQRKLQTALDDNRFLVRELHHRVKNSLQVVQSYIGLTKRDYRGEARVALADAECRVHVLSAAYRFTLADGEMQPVRVDPFLDDVVMMISNLIRRRDQWVVSRIETHASLSVDRIIPLGFLVVDVVARALRHAPGVSITITVADIDENVMEISIESDQLIAHNEPPKLFAGLMAQIEATQTLQPNGLHLGAWRVTHRA